MKFRYAIVRTPGRSLAQGISTAKLGKPTYERAVFQHQQYIAALQQCGVQVIVLEATEAFPDAVFIEDTAVITPQCAVITNPGAQSRKGEEQGIRDILAEFIPRIEQIVPPATLEGGDVMQVGKRFYVGLSRRTNAEGAEQFRQLMTRYGYATTIVPLQHFLHLKTGLAYLEGNTLLVAGEFRDNPLFDSFGKIVIDEAEQYAANCIRVNDMVLVPSGFPRTRAAIEEAGYQTLTVDVSEFRKLDGGLSCLSLRF